MRLQILPVIFLFLSLLLTDWYIFCDIRRNGGRQPYGRRFSNGGRRLPLSFGETAFLVFAVLTVGLLAVTLLIPHRSAENDIQAKMWMLYTVLSILASQTVYTLFSLIGLIPRIWFGRTWNAGLFLGLPLGLLTFVAAWWGVFVEPRTIEVTRISIASDRLPDSFNGYRVVQFSDIHLGTWGNDTTFISTLVDSINALEPDLVVFTGDVVNRQTSEMKPFLGVLSRLKARDGVLSVLGNHDYGDYITWNDPSERERNNALMAEWQKKIGWRLLDNDHVFLTSEKGDSIVVIGVGNWGEPPFSTYGNLDAAYPLSLDSAYNVNDSRYKILLSHNPEHWSRQVVGCSNIDLTLSGHTHAMQFMLKFGDWKWSPASFKYSRWGGLYEERNRYVEPLLLYVNIGAGEVGLPMRIGATPEITLITLHSGGTPQPRFGAAREYWLKKHPYRPWGPARFESRLKYPK